MNARIHQLVQLWEATKETVNPGKDIPGQLTDYQAAGYTLWIYGGCLEAALLMVGRLMASCTADRYPLWFNVNSILKEVENGEAP